LYQDWANDAWVNSERMSFSFDDKSNLLEYLYEKWIDSAWTNFEKTSYNYDENSNLLTDLSQIWENNNWANYNKTSYTYNESGSQTGEHGQTWRNNEWADLYRFQYTYNEDGLVIYLLYEEWTQEGSLSARVRSNSTYDSFGNKLTEFIEQEFNGNWQNSGRYTYTFDQNGNCLTAQFESWQDGAWTNWDDVLEFYEKNSRRFSFNSYRIEVYRDGITSAEDQVLSILKDSKVSPNPFSNSATLSYEINEPGFVTIHIFNSLGEKVGTILNEYKEAGSYKTDINSSSYPSGMYYYTIRSGNSVTTGRIVILK
jgi:hypothetical protein